MERPTSVTLHHPTGAWPTGHIGWSFSGIAEFQGRIATFLAEGAARGERIMVVADDPRPELWPAALADAGQLLVLSTSEVYGPERTVVAGDQRATFMEALSGALSDGFSGLRVAADNTGLVDSPERLAGWMRWEDEADRLMRALPITGLCSFDRTRLDTDTLRTAIGVHTQEPRAVRTPRSVTGTTADRQDAGRPRHQSKVP